MDGDVAGYSSLCSLWPLLGRFFGFSRDIVHLFVFQMESVVAGLRPQRLEL